MMTSQYHAYLMRIWQSSDLPKDQWFISIEDPSTHKITYFKNMDEFFAFIRTIPKENKEKLHLSSNEMS